MHRRHFLTLTAALAAPRAGRAADSPAALEERILKIVRGFMDERGVPGGQVALGRGGRILFSKGLGMADTEKKSPVEPRTLFRIASISKPLTGVAILVLAEEGRLSLDEHLLDVLKPDIFLPEGRRGDPRLKDITIRHLLQHTAGWDRDRSGDIMFEGRKIAETLKVPCPPGPADVIREGLGRPLDFDPGTRYAYSNFGYCILGRIIEKRGGTGYEQFVRERVLAPAGITGPKLGATLTTAAGEARYYTAEKGDEGTAAPVFPGLPDKVPWAYGAWSLETMDSHGGWIACAEDIVRFAMSLEDTGGKSPFKQRSTWETLIAPPPGAPGHDSNGRPLPASYGCGFSVRRSEAGKGITHNGSLPGTNTFIWKRADGFTWAAFFNLRRDGGKSDAALVQPVNAALDAAG